MNLDFEWRRRRGRWKGRNAEGFETRSTKANAQANPYLDRDIGPVTFRPGGCFGVDVHGYPSKIPICPVVMRSHCARGGEEEKDRSFLRSIGQ